MGQVTNELTQPEYLICRVVVVGKTGLFSEAELLTGLLPNVAGSFADVQFRRLAFLQLHIQSPIRESRW